MKLNNFTSFAIMLMASIILLASCKEKEYQASDPEAFAEFITSHSSGIISSMEEIKVILAREVSEGKMKEGAEGLIYLKPSVKGETQWLNSRTLVFRPGERMEPDQTYEVGVALNRLFGNEQQEDYKFLVKTVEAEFRHQLEGYRAFFLNDTLRSEVNGSITTSDSYGAEDVEAILTALQDGNKLQVEWDHMSDGYTHNFRIRGISRGEQPQSISIELNGKSLGIEREVEEEISIPPINEFSYLSARSWMDEGQVVIITFSDPLDPDQETEGLFSIPGHDPGIEIENNTVRIYPGLVLAGEFNLTIDPGLKNYAGYRLGTPERVTLEFTSIKPEIRFTGAGHIVPGQKGLPVPFEAINLSAVDVRVIEIYEKNVPYFFQVNDLGGNNSLRQYGRPVYEGVLSLSSQHEPPANEWSAYKLDLSELGDVNPGSIYRVELSMRPAYSLYPCPDGSGLKDLHLKETADNEYWDDMNVWRENDWFYYNNLWDWRERDNPCDPAYYSPNRRVYKNLIASNLGLLAKAGTDGKLHVIVTDIKTTDPLENARVRVYDLQQQLLGEGTTNSSGMLELETEGTPFLLIAVKGEEKGYLKLNDGNSLQMSMFDVSGERVQKGLKGFIYGERDVWRPGDSLFISFILEDKGNKVEKGHPVVFELYNPSGQFVEKKIEKYSGLITTFRLNTSDDAPTGNYQSVIRLGGASFSKRIRIETIKPNRLKIEFNTEPKVLHTYEGNPQARITAKWLHGTPASGMESRVEMNISKGVTAFKGFADYIFENQEASFHWNKQEIFKGNLDAEGNLGFPLKLSEASQAPGKMHAIFTVRVFEPSGNFSTAQFEKDLHPYEHYVGIKLPEKDKRSPWYKTGMDQHIGLAVLDTDGNAAEEEVEVRVYKVRWRWWWESSSDYLGSYVSGSNHVPVFKGTFSPENGRAQFTLNMEDEQWGRYLIVARLASGHVSTRTMYFDWPYGRKQHEGVSGPAMLMLTTDKERYSTGEIVKYSFPSADDGKALVSIETGSRVLHKSWVNTKEGQTELELETGPEMTPNAYIHVTYIQPYERPSNDQPIRLYGAVPLQVVDKSTHLYPELGMPDELRSSQEFEISVSEKEGRAMAYTIAVVDEGLLDITGFKTPDPWSHFYAREALGVKTWDVFDDVLGAYGGRLEQLFAVGGGSSKTLDPSRQKQNRFEPVVRFLGPFILEKGKTDRHKLKLPRYTGSVRVMLVAAKDKAYGSVEKAVPVRDPLMVLATVPRVLGPGDRFDLPVNVFVQKSGIKDVRISVSAEGPVSIAGSATKTLAFDRPGEKDVDFQMSADVALGWAKIVVTASSGNETADYPVNVEVRNANPRMVKSETRILKENAQWEPDVSPVGIPSTSEMRLELSGGPAMNLSHRLSYLIRYPHGCIEQTTSAVFPQLYLLSVGNIDAGQAVVMKNHINNAIRQFSSFQLPGGGFSYWPGNSYYSDWGTTYAGHFMIDAEKRGFVIPAGMKNKWLKHQRDAANHWRPEFNSRWKAVSQAYRLYTLALAGKPQFGAMNRLRESGKVNAEARWMLALAYLEAGRPEVAEKLVDLLAVDYHSYNSPGPTYGSRLRDKAILLEVLTRLGRQEYALDLAMEVSGELCSDRWMSTQTTAFALRALSLYNTSLGLDRHKPVSCLVEVDGEKMKVTAEVAGGGTSMDIPADARSVKVTREDPGVLFATLIKSGKPANKVYQAEENGLRINVEFFDMSGNRISAEQIAQGTDFTATARVKNTSFRALENVALTHVFPSGWEIINERLLGGADPNDYDYQDIRDDRLLTYFDLPMGREISVKVRLNATYAGEYYSPGAYVEAMYDSRISGRTSSKIVTVTRR